MSMTDIIYVISIPTSHNSYVDYGGKCNAPGDVGRYPLSRDKKYEMITPLVGTNGKIDKWDV